MPKAQQGRSGTCGKRLLLFLTDEKQVLAYGNGDQPGLGDLTVQNSVPPTQQFNIVKQVSVPHGNSILAPGRYQSSDELRLFPLHQHCPEA